MRRELYRVVDAFEEFSLEYCILESSKELEGKIVEVYGIEVRKGEEISEVRDISSNKKLVEKLLENIIKNTVTPITLKNVIQDFVEDTANNEGY